jgi:hypothetical protein
MKRKQIETEIVHTGRYCSNYSDNRYKWSEVLQILKEKNVTLQDSDILEVGLAPGWDDGDSARDDYYELTVTRVREETDEEFEVRKQQKELFIARNKQSRLEQYLKLKEEFEEPHQCCGNCGGGESDII